MINILLILTITFMSCSCETHIITFYYPNEDSWGTAVADPALMSDGPLPDESWYWPLVAISRDVERDYPMGTWLWIEGIGIWIEYDGEWHYIPGIGLRRVSDRTAGWVKNIVDVRSPEPHMDRFESRVWVLWRPDV